MDAGQVKTMAAYCDIVWSGEFEGPPWGDPCLPADALR